MQPAIESKNHFAMSPELPGSQLPFPSGCIFVVDETVQSTSQEKIKYLVEENAKLRKEIKALKTIIKNIRN